MKNEYIAGDLVKYLSQVVKIVEVYQDGTCYFGNETMCGQQDCKDAEPIPLTPEILEKNGWKHKKEFGEYWFVPRNEDFELLALDKVGEEWTIYIEENSSNFENIKFAHQLQHLLFGLGLNSEMEV